MLILLLSSVIHAAKITEFTDSFKQPRVLLDDKQIYIVDALLYKISIYSRKDFKKIGEFGKRGEAPGEFIGIGNVSINTDYITVAAFPKICYFSKSGKFIKEKKYNISNAGNFIPVGDNLVGESHLYSKPTDINGKLVFSLFDSDFEKKKDLRTIEFQKFSKWNGTKETILLIRPCFKAVVSNDKILIGSSAKGFFFVVFDRNGNKLNEINRAYEKRKVTNADKKNELDYVQKTTTDWNKQKAMYEMEFPEFFPAYFNFGVDNGKIYVFIDPKDNKIECQVLDLKGNLLKRNFLPNSFGKQYFDARFFCIKEGQFFYLIDNENTEKWELHSLKLD